MKRIRYLSMLVLLHAGSIILWAQGDTFDPTSPAEPGPPGGNVPMLSLIADPIDGGTVSGAGWYDNGSQVTLRAYNKTNFVFDHWANADGETVSTSSQFKYIKKEDDEMLTAYFRFSPGSPAEPLEIAQSVYHLLTLVSEEGGSVSGGGKYLPGSRIYLSASVNTGFAFRGWYNENDELISPSAFFYYTTTAKAVRLTARFDFCPASPGDPSEPSIDTTPKHSLTVIAEEGGTVNTGGSTMKEGATLKLTATANTGYVFKGWYKEGVFYNASNSITFTMGTEDIGLVAYFTFNPSSPGDPSTPSTKKYAFYLMNVVTKPGTTIQYPIYLTSIDELSDIAFQLTFPEELQPDLNNFEMSAKAENYTISVAAGADANSYVITLTGGIVPDGNTPILVFSVPIPIDIATAQNYQVKINQVTVKETDGTVTTASTRNGHISVYKNGDANGDNTVDVYDYIGIANDILHVTQDAEFIREAGDVNDSGEIDVCDYMGVANIILYDNIYGPVANDSRRAAQMENSNNSASNNHIYLEPFKAATNSQATVSFKMKNTADIRGFQFDLYLPKGISVVKDAKNRIQGLLTSNRKPEGDQHTLTLSEQENGAIRFLCSSMNDETFTGSDGEIATLTVSIAGDMAQGDYPILLKKMKLSESNISNCYETESRMATITINNNSATGIEQLTTGSGNETYYNLQGQRVNTPAKGVFVKNGKKVMIK